MADINVDVNLPSAISVDITSPTQALATNISIPGPQGPTGPRGFSPLINGITGESILFSGKDGIIISTDQSIDTIFVSGNSGHFQSAVNSLTTNLNNTGTNLNTSINSLSGLFTGYTGSLDATYATDSQLANTGSTLNTKIDNFSGYVNSTGSNIVFTTGNQTISGDKIFKNNIVMEQTGIFSAIDLSDTDSILLSGIDIQIVSGSMTLTNPPTISGNPFITGNLALYSTITNLASTGSTLNSSINSLSGTLTSTYATISNLASTGSTLDTKINNLSGSSVLLYGDQSVSGVKTFANNISVQGTGIFDALDLSNISDFSFSGVTINLINSTVQSSGGNFIVYGSGNFTSGLDLNNSKLINSIPEIINLSTNFNISGNYNSRMIMVNSATEVTGRIVSGNSLGFNATIMQVGVGQVLITGSGIGINIGSYNNQYRTAGQFATISLLHTGNNGYTMYGNTAA